MKKKLIKKKVTTQSDDVEMPMARMDDDVAEDYKVIDMSDIAAPVIGFELPNLVEKKEELKEEKKTSPKKTSPKKTKKVAVKGKKEVLTAEKLNNELVGLRAVVVKGKNQLMSRLVRQKKKLEAKKGAKSDETQRKVARLTEEIVALKTVDKDTVAKFAVMNTKGLAELKIDGKTPVSERLLYKLATQESVVKGVETIREKYTEWNTTAAFFMQRLGLQYSNKPKKEEKKKENGEDGEDEEEGSETPGEEGSEEEESEEEEEGEEEEDVEGEERDEDYNESDIEMVDSDEESGDQAAKKRRDLLLGLIGAKEDKSRPALKPKKRKIENEDEDVVVQKKSKAKETTKQEMSRILEKELKSKAVQNPKKNGKTNSKSKKKNPVKAKKEEEQKEIAVEEEDSDQKTLIVKVDLSKGGKIADTKRTQVTTKTVESKKDDEEDDDESAAFFLPKSGFSSKKQPEKLPKKGLPIEKKRVPVDSQKQKNAAPVSEKTEKKKGSSKNNTATGEMHPSWAASQLKKKEMQSAKPCGKKITFGDDDD